MTKTIKLDAAKLLGGKGHGVTMAGAVKPRPKAK